MEAWVAGLNNTITNNVLQINFFSSFNLNLDFVVRVIFLQEDGTPKVRKIE